MTRESKPHRGSIRKKKNTPDQYKARYTLNNTVYSGKIIKPKKCSKCLKKSKYIHGHHENYKKPLEVIWVCHQCHLKIHKEYV